MCKQQNGEINCTKLEYFVKKNDQGVTTQNMDKSPKCLVG